MMDDRCPRCQHFYEAHPLHDGHHEISSHVRMGMIRCAFPAGVFSPENWNCQTMIALRELTQQEPPSYDFFHAHHRYDDSSIGILCIPDVTQEEVQSGYIVMTWYKDRGTTGQAWVMEDNDLPQRLTLVTAEAVLAYLEPRDSLGYLRPVNILPTL